MMDRDSAENYKIVYGSSIFYGLNYVVHWYVFLKIIKVKIIVYMCLVEAVYKSLIIKHYCNWWP